MSELWPSSPSMQKKVEVVDAKELGIGFFLRQSWSFSTRYCFTASCVNIVLRLPTFASIHWIPAAIWGWWNTKGIMMNVIGIGDNVVDKYVHTQTMYPGGNALNFAAYAAMLGSTMRPIWGFW